MTHTLSADQIAHTEQAMDALHHALERASGSLSFAEFMHFALYQPGVGYYVSGNQKFGAGGDFTTAPLISPLFSACLGNYCAAQMEHLPGAVILELGAGTGDMAAGILQRLHTLNTLPEQYLILEPSAELRARQQMHLKETLPPELFTRLQWLDGLPTDRSLTAIILANEVIDAMAVERVIWQNGAWQQQCVCLEDGELAYHTRAIEDKRLQSCCAKLPTTLADGYLTEVNTWIEPWLQSLRDSLEKGVVCLIDYGFPCDEYYHPQRDQGTLQCHFMHQSHDNPLTHIGLQDITAHVDFSAVREGMEKSGMQPSDYSNQTQFLIDCGLTDLLADVTDRNDYEKLLPGVKQLTHPQEMGELFKVAQCECN